MHWEYNLQYLCLSLFALCLHLAFIILGLVIYFKFPDVDRLYFSFSIGFIKHSFNTWKILAFSFIIWKRDMKLVSYYLFTNIDATILKEMKLWMWVSSPFWWNRYKVQSLSAIYFSFWFSHLFLTLLIIHGLSAEK